MNSISKSAWMEILSTEEAVVSGLFDADGALMVVLDGQGCIVRFSGACEKISGYTLAEVKGKPFWDLLLKPEHIEPAKAAFERLLAGQSSNASYENVWRTKHGEHRLITWSHMTLRNSTGQVDYIISTGLDISKHKEIKQVLRRVQHEMEQRVLDRATELLESNDSLRREVAERKRAESALRQSEARLRAIANAVPDVLMMLDEDGRYIEILTSQTHLLYADPESFKGKLVHDVLPLPVADRVLSAIRQTMATRQIQVIEYELWISRVGRRYFEARTAPIEVHGKIKDAIVVLARDITHRKVTEEKLRQAQKMEAIGQLTGGVAHDFNNLLAIVLGNLELLEEQLAEQPGLKDLVRRAFEAADRGAILTKRLLAFSRRQPLLPKSTDLNKLVLGMTDLLQRTLGETIQVKTVLADDLLPTMIDPAQFETGLLNLVLNARDAMPKGGTLTIETANRWLDEDYARMQLYYVRPGQYVMLAVSDTGTGMSAEVMEHAFEPFFTTKEVGKGSGLGLSMVYGLVRQSGGYINIYSEIGKGTVVRIYLPWTQQTATNFDAPEVPKPVPQRGGEETILVVEDDNHVRQLAVSLLNSLGYRTLEACNAKEALDFMQENHEIALLFTDVVLPGGMDGKELVRAARDRRPDLKVLLTSGYTEGSYIEDDLKGSVDLLAKPYRRASLASKLGTILGNR